MTDLAWAGRAARAFASATMALVVSACASTSPTGQGGLVDRVLGGGHVHGDAEQVTITGVGGVASALPFAIGHCSRFGKSAQYQSRSDNDYTFRCVAK